MLDRGLGRLFLNLSLHRLRWVAIGVPAALFVAWELLSHFVIHAYLTEEWPVFLITVGAVGVGATLFTNALFRLLERLQDHLVRQNRELSARTAALETLYEIGTHLSALLDLSTLKETAVRRARQLFRSDVAGLALLDRAQGEIRWELLAGPGSGQFRHLTLSAGECVAGTVLQSGEPFILENARPQVEAYPGRYPLLEQEGLQAVLAVPVRIAGQPVGVLMVGHRTPYSFHLADLRLLMGLANQVAVAINNAHLHRRLQALSALEERERLAREMHDGLAQVLGHITARTTAVRALLDLGRLEEARRHLERLQEVAREGYLEVRQAILGLRTRPREGRFVEAVQELAEWFNGLGDVPVAVEAAPEVRGLSLAPPVEVQALRIVQEALHNVQKHAGARQAWIRLRGQEGALEVTVEDDGRGFHPESDGATHHLGLRTMRERAEAVGGQLRILSAPGQGTRVVLTLPLHEEA